jgi:alpha-methylacyl-CoA racemase
MGPLKGKRIIELAGIGPGPFACMMLADMGAEVITIDRKAAQIHLPPKDPTLRNRKSIAINLKSAEGIELVLQLCEKADALVEGYRPGVIERLGLGSDILLKRNPKIILGRMTGWGQDGPLAQSVGHDINYISINGVLEKMGRRGQKPTPPLNLVGDYGGGGMMLAFGVVCAMLEAQSSGKGQVIDAAMIDGSAALMAYLYGFETNPFYQPYKERDNHLFGGNNHFYNTYETQDGKYVSVGPLEGHFYLELIERLGKDKEIFINEWLGCPDADISKFPELEKKMQEIFITKTRDEWVKIFEGSNACFAPVLTFAEAQQHPHITARQTFVTIDGTVQAAPSPRFSRTQADMPQRPRMAGEDTQVILHDILQLDTSRIDGLIANGVVESLS